MSNLTIQSAAFKEIESMCLDLRFHPYGVQINPFGASGVTCNDGVHTYQVCNVIANYTPKSRFDLSFLIYRVWNAIKAIFGSSDWQKGIELAVEYAPNIPGLTPEDGSPLYGKRRSIQNDPLTSKAATAIFDKALALNWQGGKEISVPSPTPCAHPVFC